MQQPALDGFSFAQEGAPCGRKLKQQQGQRANMTGARAEALIYCFFKETGHEVSTQHPIGQAIHGGTIYVDFYIHQTGIYPEGLIIESKWQESAGSVDEKLVFLVENIRSRYPCPTLIVYGGGGARPGMIEWMKQQVDGRRLIGVFTLEEFVVWANRNL